jgi:hypothetical protein
LWFVAAFTTGAASAAGNDPRLDLALSTNVLSQVERSVQFEKTLPQPARLPKPAVDPSEAVQVSQDVYIDRRLVPQSRSTDDNAIRVSPRDASGSPTDRR